MRGWMARWVTFNLWQRLFHGWPSVTIIRMVKFFIQLYSSNDYFVWFYWIGDRPRRWREEERRKEGFNSNIKRIIPALFVLQFERNWICPLLYPARRSIWFRGYEFYEVENLVISKFCLCFLLILFEYAFDWKKIWNLKDWIEQI